ncbi:MAG: HAD hydrolase family protein [Candidatus Uhrbacteria bacterium]|nr:HAD hydrolase family protein [Candidatus Uhrbacteria bacterium]
MSNILLDLHDTLTDSRYRLLGSGIRSAIANVIDRGYTIGINSDSSFEACRTLYEQLGLNGPIICENGAGLSIDGISEVLSAFTQDASRFVNLRSTFISLCGRHSSDLHVSSLEGMSFVQGGDLLIKIGHHFRDVILVNPFRRWSLCFYARRHDCGKFDFSPELLGWGVDVLRGHVAEDDRFGDLWWDINHDYGICIVHDASTHKKRGVAKLLEKTASDSLIMIGNSMSDFVGDARVRQFAVANASEEYKARCELVASEPLTLGVAELLNCLPSLNPLW